jgi:sarcosine oxidase subunit alpha
VVGFYDDRELVAVTERLEVRVRANIIVLATGAYAQPPACTGNDAPGILALRAAEEALARGVLPGRRVVVAVAAEAGDAWMARARRFALALAQAGVDVPAVVHLPEVQSRRRATTILGIAGRAPSLQVQLDDAADPVGCDALVWAGRVAPAYELARQMGIDTPFDAARGGFVPTCDASGETSRDGVFVAGELAGVDAALAAEHGRRVGEAVTRKLRRIPDVEVG